MCCLFVRSFRSFFSFVLFVRSFRLVLVLVLVLVLGSGSGSVVGDWLFFFFFGRFRNGVGND